MDKIHINLGGDSYDIVIDNGLVNKAGPMIRELTGATKAAIITEDGIDKLYGNDLVKSLEEAGMSVQMIVVPSSKKFRTLRMVSKVYGALVDFGFGSDDLLIALGGRIVGDITGFAAATYRRGVRYIQFPTSVLAQIGSSIGGKITLDTDAGKDIVGTFYQPKAVYIDPGMAKTLPRRFFHNGLGEAVRLGCVADRELFELFEKVTSDMDIYRVLPEIIRRCCIIKAHYVELDPLSKNERRLLDFGHTIGSAIERCSRYNNMEITHGEATAIGMYRVTQRSEAEGATVHGTAGRLEYVLKSLSLPISTAIPNKILLEALKQDKNLHGDTIPVTIITEIGKGEIRPATLNEIIGALKD
ncbi:3-dehydroquinate synthase [uncultured Dialister sp.]|uniref:3-dehydroquinate synthase family protein n=1 Tax=uncultured Dialister sp. TaxID=278064 RepID=UPI0025D4F5B4|nr:3-dehydroquinate synthase family protein [uncultured Dialister sp.]